jgi:hypothetical protein
MWNEKDFQSEHDVKSMTATVRRACDAAIQHPSALFLFIDRYTRWNGYAGALVAKLAGNIGQSQDLFVCPDEPDQAQAMHGMDIAAYVLDGTVDEHRDKGHGVPHRTLGRAMRKAAADYAGLSLEERNDLSRVPGWLEDLVSRTIDCYSGVADDAETLVRSLGVHIASEALADREYAVIDTVFRAERHHEGFYQYLRERDYRVEIDDQRVHAYAWVTIHATFQSHGVEMEHLEGAIKALQLAARYRPEPPEKTFALAREGFQQFSAIQREFFDNVAKECLSVTERQMTEA